MLPVRKTHTDRQSPFRLIDCPRFLLKTNKKGLWLLKSNVSSKKVYDSSEKRKCFGIQFPLEGDQILALDQLLASLECFPINENIKV